MFSPSHVQNGTKIAVNEEEASGSKEKGEEKSLLDLDDGAVIAAGGAANTKPSATAASSVSEPRIWSLCLLKQRVLNELVAISSSLSFASRIPNIFAVVRVLLSRSQKPTTLCWPLTWLPLRPLRHLLRQKLIPSVPILRPSRWTCPRLRRPLRCPRIFPKHTWCRRRPLRWTCRTP